MRRLNKRNLFYASCAVLLALFFVYPIVIWNRLYQYRELSEFISIQKNSEPIFVVRKIYNLRFRLSGDPFGPDPGSLLTKIDTVTQPEVWFFEPGLRVTDHQAKLLRGWPMNRCQSFRFYDLKPDLIEKIGPMPKVQGFGLYPIPKDVLSPITLNDEPYSLTEKQTAPVRFTGESMLALVQAAPKLESINLSGCLRYDGSELDTLSQLDTYQLQINLSNTQVTNKTLALLDLRIVRELTLNFSDVDGEQWINEIKAHDPYEGIEQLHLRGIGLTDDSIKILVHLFPNLSSIDLRDNEHTAKSKEHFKKLGNLRFEKSFLGLPADE